MKKLLTNYSRASTITTINNKSVDGEKDVVGLLKRAGMVRNRGDTDIIIHSIA
ncbi:hypothetical protein ABID14_000318 [Peptoniphilus olsenii]|uniref:Uncharacterized protein n=1 Tax=Peptoniphilus olsenii TaxID=411570 RepID=A0ABV2J7T2_9FIRM